MAPPTSITSDGNPRANDAAHVNGNGIAHQNGTHCAIQNGTTSNGVDHALEVEERYKAERAKRLRPDFDAQFVKLHGSEKWKHFTEDPWLPPDGSAPGLKLEEGHQLRTKFAVQGCGYGALIHAARLVEAGYNPKDFLFVDYASGWGGTWYWNRYPGLMCDVAAEVYMPLLEETNYMPKHKYAYGQELREHAERIAKHYGFSEQVVFRATVGNVTWNDQESFWEVSVVQEQGSRQGLEAVKIRTKICGDFFISLSGVLNYPKLPGLPGMDDFGGHQFHTSRWDYNYTGGSQEVPDMINLKNKRVGLVGTGPTNIQAFPELAKWAKELYLFQRTPSAVDERGQRPIDPEDWKRHHSKRGWQTAARDNMAAFTSDEPEKPKIDLISDRWTGMPSHRALCGSSKARTIDPQNPSTIAGYIKDLHVQDFPRQERLRCRIDEIVRDKDTAERLKPWYPGWCKRPCFHDDYLPAFNQANVHLVDTEGKGIERMTSAGVVVAGKEYPVDLLIWGTGFVLNLSASPDERGLMTVRGRNGLTMREKWAEGVATLHGSITRDFPNFFFPVTQCGVAANNIHIFEVQAEHAVYLIKEAERRSPGKRVMIEPTEEAEEAWSMRIAALAGAFAGMSGCTPSYFNSEGKADADMENASPEKMLKAARSSPWGLGICDFANVIREWRENGNFEGVDVTVVD